MLRSNSTETNTLIAGDAKLRHSRRRPRHLASNLSDNKKIADFEKATLVGRLQELSVMEIHQDGSRTYLQLSVRGLYKHVIACITNIRNYSNPPNINSSSTKISSHLSRNASVRFEVTDQSDSREARGFFSVGPPSSDLIEESKKKITNYPVQTILTKEPIEEPSFVRLHGNMETLPPPPPPFLLYSRTDASVYSASKSPNVTHRSLPFAVESNTTSIPSLPKPLKRGGRNVSVGLYNDAGVSLNDLTRSPPKRTSSTGSDINPPLPCQQQQQQQVTYRERLGAYIHPRDMRRLVTPFSASNEPELIVRRHVMLLNFDPLRAIILRDRLLVLVPDGADSILASLEHRIRGGADEVINSIFGHNVEDEEEMITNEQQELNENPSDGFETTALIKESAEEIPEYVESMTPVKVTDSLFSNNDGAQHQIEMQELTSVEESRINEQMATSNAKTDEIFGSGNATGAPATRAISTRQFSLPRSMSMNALNEISNCSLLSSAPFVSKHNCSVLNGVDMTNNELIADQNESDSEDDGDEWDEMEGREWIDLPFELLCVDAVLFVIGTMLTVETEEIRRNAADCINRLLTNESPGVNGDHPLTSIRSAKDAIREMRSRVKGFVQSINRILDEDEDMALMNLSRLLTHPQRFVQPVPQEVLEEESDEPELILEANLQIILSILNSLDLIQGQIDTASGLVDQKLDALRNRLLFAEMVISVFTFAATVAAVIGSFFGMNVPIPLHENDNAFRQVVIGTLVGSVAIVGLVLWILVYSGTVPRISFQGI